MAVMTSFYAIRALRGPILSLSSAPLNVDLNCRAEYFYLLVGRGEGGYGARCRKHTLASRRAGSQDRSSVQLLQPMRRTQPPRTAGEAAARGLQVIQH
jgi:hypothetical protein